MTDDYRKPACTAPEEPTSPPSPGEVFIAAVRAEYLALEARMLAHEAAGDEAAADLLRDEMDPLWQKLSPEDRAKLDARGKAAP